MKATDTRQGYDRMAARIEKFGVGKDHTTDVPDEVVEDVTWLDPAGQIVVDPEQIQRLEAAYAAQLEDNGA